MPLWLEVQTDKREFLCQLKGLVERRKVTKHGSE